MRLLLVEDEALQREMLAGHLQARGYVVYSVGSAEEALEEVQAHRVDIVLADLPPEITAPSAGHPSPVPDGPVDLEALISELEQSHLRKALETCKGNQTRAAEVLGLSERVLRYKLKKHGIFRGPHQ